MEIYENGNHFHVSSNKSRVRHRDSFENIAMGARALLQSEQDKHVRDEAESVFFVAAKQRRIKSQVLEEASWGSLPCYGESTLRSSFVSPGFDYIFFKKKII